MESYSSLNSWLRLKKSCTWNSTKTLGKTSIFQVPNDVLFDEYLMNELLPVTDNSIHDKNVAEPEMFGGKTCQTCSLNFNSVYEQKSHFKSELHKINLNRRLKKKAPLTQKELESQTHFVDDNDYDNGKDSPDENSDEENEASSDEDVEDANILKIDDEDRETRSSMSAIGSCVKTYSNRTGHRLIYRKVQETKWEIIFNISVVYNPNNKNLDLTNHLREVSNLIKNKDDGCWAVLILRSGKFAGAIFQQNTPIVHKVFRRYTIRAKAGGTQSSHDKHAGKAQSMGAQLRRYGEQALKEDVQTLMINWAGHLQTCSHILISVPKLMYPVLFEYSHLMAGQIAPLNKQNPRICFIPFMVGKPTFEEVKSVHDKCTAILFRPISVTRDHSDDLESLADIDEDLLSFDKPNEFLLNTIPDNYDDDNDDDLERRDKSIKEQEEEVLLPKMDECLPSKELIQACLAEDVEKVKSILHSLKSESIQLVNDDSGEEDDDDDELNNNNNNNQQSLRDVSTESNEWNLDAVINFPDNIENLKTPLHIASEMGNASLVRILLQYGANPGVVDVRSRTPYHVAKDKSIRETFRRIRGQNESRWNWDEAGVDAPLTNELERIHKEKVKEKKKRAKERKKAEKLREAQEKEEKQRLLEQQKLEEEATKKALMERLAFPCDNCGRSMLGIPPQIFLDKRCCSTACTLAMRRSLAAAAALSRAGKA